jgi:hypothetical protein
MQTNAFDWANWLVGGFSLLGIQLQNWIVLVLMLGWVSWPGLSPDELSKVAQFYGHRYCQTKKPQPEVRIRPELSCSTDCPVGGIDIQAHRAPSAALAPVRLATEIAI